MKRWMYSHWVEDETGELGLPQILMIGVTSVVLISLSGYGTEYFDLAENQLRRLTTFSGNIDRQQLSKPLDAVAEAISDVSAEFLTSEAGATADSDAVQKTTQATAEGFMKVTRSLLAASIIPGRVSDVVEGAGPEPIASPGNSPAVPVLPPSAGPEDPPPAVFAPGNERPDPGATGVGLQTDPQEEGNEQEEIASEAGGEDSATESSGDVADSDSETANGENAMSSVGSMPGGTSAGFPGQGYPGLGFPGQGYPGQGYPEDNLLPQGGAATAWNGRPTDQPVATQTSENMDSEFTVPGSVAGSELPISEYSANAMTALGNPDNLGQMHALPGDPETSQAVAVTDEEGQQEPEEDLQTIEVIGVDWSEPEKPRLRVRVHREFRQLQVWIDEVRRGFQSPRVRITQSIVLTPDQLQPGQRIELIGVEQDGFSRVQYTVPEVPSLLDYEQGSESMPLDLAHEFSNSAMQFEEE